MLRAFSLVLVLAGLCCATVQAKDDDKRRLFNTFFVESGGSHWHLILRADRTFALTAPDGRNLTGSYVASSEELAIAGRHFEFEFRGTDVELKPTKKDNPNAGSLAGEMPPQARGNKVKWLSIQTWTAAGRDPKTPAPEVAVAPERPAAEPPPSQLVRAADVSGIFQHTDVNGGQHKLTLTPGDRSEVGTFDYTTPGGQTTHGTYAYIQGILTLDSGFHRRHFAVAEALGGIQVTRRDTDVLKDGDTLGSMPPQERAPIAYRRQGAASPPPEASRPAETGKDPLPPVRIEEPAPVVARPETPPPAETPRPVLPAAAPAGLQALAGRYAYQPNPLVTEEWLLRADGSFTYTDTNGAKADGQAALDGSALTLTSGEVVRRFAMQRAEDGSLTLTREANDKPKITNDLATMSPSVLKSAKYEKK